MFVIDRNLLTNEISIFNERKLDFKFRLKKLGYIQVVLLGKPQTMGVHVLMSPLEISLA
jgi:hypothetical protein